MKIVIVTQTFPLNPKDSTAHFMYDFTQGFKELGHQVTVFLPFNSKLKIKPFKGLTLLPFRYIWPDSLHLLGFGNTLSNDQYLKWYIYIISPIFYIIAIIKLCLLASKTKVDIINAHWILPNGFICAVVCRIFKIPLVITLPGSDVYIARKNILFRAMAKFAAASARTIVSNSPQLLKNLSVKGKIISYPVMPNNYPRPANSSLKVATAGRDVEKKGNRDLKKDLSGN